MGNETIERPETDQAFKSFLQNLQNAKQDEDTEQPQMYAVILHNDDSTFPDFVVQVLTDAFKVPNAGNVAMNVMLTAHRTGKCVVCVRPKDVAETQLEAAVAMIKAAVPDENFSVRMNGGSQVCALTFSIEPEATDN